VWANAPGRHAKVIMAFTQEVKRNMVYRKYNKETINNITHYHHKKMLGNLHITVRKIENLREYQGKCNMF
jgi:predicted RecB family nuclease